jgi:hypothetical protein
MSEVYVTQNLLNYSDEWPESYGLLVREVRCSCSANTYPFPPDD